MQVQTLLTLFSTTIQALKSFMYVWRKRSRKFRILAVSPWKIKYYKQLEHLPEILMMFLLINVLTVWILVHVCGHIKTSRLALSYIYNRIVKNISSSIQIYKIQFCCTSLTVYIHDKWTSLEERKYNKTWYSHFLSANTSDQLTNSLIHLALKHTHKHVHIRMHSQNFVSYSCLALFASKINDIM